MIGTKRTALFAKKWQRMSALGRKRLTCAVAMEADECCTSLAVKGHCVLDTSNGRRFEVPLAYFNTSVFSELLWMSQEEFGFLGNGRITLPCDAAIMEYAMSMLRRGSSAEVRGSISEQHGTVMPLGMLMLVAIRLLFAAPR